MQLLPAVTRRSLGAAEALGSALGCKFRGAWDVWAATLAQVLPQQPGQQLAHAMHACKQHRLLLNLPCSCMERLEAQAHAFVLRSLNPGLAVHVPGEDDPITLFRAQARAADYFSDAGPMQSGRELGAKLGSGGILRAGYTVARIGTLSFNANSMPCDRPLRSRCSAGHIAGAGGAQCWCCGCCFHHYQQLGGRSCPLSLLVLRQLQQQASQCSRPRTSNRNISYRSLFSNMIGSKICSVNTAAPAFEVEDRAAAPLSCQGTKIWR